MQKSVSEIFVNTFGFEAKEKQLEATTAVMKGGPKTNTVFVALPTGYGKSMCYLAPPLLLDKVYRPIQ